MTTPTGKKPTHVHSKVEEHHDHQFRGTWNPPALFDLLSDGIISAPEFVLLSFIESLINNDHGGCYASNSYLARPLNVAPHWISRMIAHLRKLGILHVLGTHDGKNGRRRVLYTSWSHVLRTSKVDPCHVRHAPLSENRQPPVGKPTAPLSENRQHSKDSIKEKDIKENNRSTSSERAYPSNPESTQEVAPMPFFPNKTKPSKNSQIDIQFATELHTALAVLGRANRWNKERWADQFRLLRFVDKPSYSISEIQNTLDWYTANAKTVQKPIILSAKMFRKVFNWLREQQAKHIPEVEISENAIFWSKQLQGLGWPKDSKTQLPKVIQVTMDSFAAFYKRLREFRSKHPREVKGKDAAPHVQAAYHLADLYHGVDGIIEEWFRRVHKSIANWNDWSGDLSRLGWNGDYTNKELNSYYCSKVTAYGLSSKAWYTLVEELSDEG